MNPQKNENRKKGRKIEYLPLKENKHYIFCEGKKTEPLYFDGFRKAIEKNPMYRHMILIEVHGVGAETLSVIEAAEKKVSEQNIKNAQIWCVYDKDGFPDERFNLVSERAASNNKKQSDVKYHVAWSNQCIEYWFILHFDYYTANNDRKYYRKYLRDKFKQLGWQEYEKNNKELFTILTKHGNPQQAIRWAKQQIEGFIGCTDSQSAPATKVHELVEELSRFLPDDSGNKYRFESQGH